MKRFLLLLLLPGCLSYAGQFDPLPARPYGGVHRVPVAPSPPPRPVNCDDERIDVMVSRTAEGAPVFPADTISTGGWDRDGRGFAAITFWATMEGASFCDPRHEIAVWDGYLREWKRP